MQHKILCIDDETHNLEALERLLRKKHHTEVADSGATALEKLKEHDFSLIISDQKMPNMTGVEFFMKAKSIQPDAIRVLLTGYTDLESVIGAINDGQIYRYITKPWEPAEFISITEQAIEVFEMKQTIRNQNLMLTQANKELKSLDKLKTDFMLLVNHELKTPLTGIFSFVQLLGEEDMPAEQKLYVQKIDKNTRRLQDLINDTLLITKLKTSAEKIERENIAVDQLIQGKWNSLEKEFAQKNLKLSIKGAENFIVSANKKYLEIIIGKLLHNSFSHSKPESEVTYKIENTNKGWSLNTTNNLEKDIQVNTKDLLEAFSTSENILNHSGGTGLGLAVIKSIANLFAAQVEIKTGNQKFDLTIHFSN